MHDWLNAGHDVLFDIDWQGARALSEKAREHVVTIFILPPSLAELERRLTTRNTDSPQIVASRMAKARAEISHYNEYDYVLVNDDFATCLAQLQLILQAEHLKRSRNPTLSVAVENILAGT